MELEVDLPVRHGVLASVTQMTFKLPGLERQGGGETHGLQGGDGVRDVGGSQQEIEVAIFASGNVTIETLGEHRPFEADGGRKRVEKPRQLGGQQQRAPQVLLEALFEPEAKGRLAAIDLRC